MSKFGTFFLSLLCFLSAMIYLIVGAKVYALVFGALTIFFFVKHLNLLKNH